MRSTPAHARQSDVTQKPIKSIRKKALIVKFGQIGDVLMAVPAAHALHEQGFEVHWVCGRVVQPLLECYSWIIPIPVNDKAIFFGRPLTRVVTILLLWNSICRAKYDLCATLYYDRRYRLITLPVRVRRALAFSRKSRRTTLLASRSMTDENARLLLGVEDSFREHSIRPVRPDTLPPSPLPAKVTARRIALVPGGATKLLRQQGSQHSPEQVLRRWPIESYVDLARRLTDRGWEVALLGGPDDAEAAHHFRDLPILNLIGRLSLPEVVSVCNCCDAVVSNDTGPMHLAALSDCCLIGIFGPTDPRTLLPRRPSVLAIWGGERLACRPCYDGQDFAPCRFNGCMHEVKPQLVLRELDRMLDDRSAGIALPWQILSSDGTL